MKALQTRWFNLKFLLYSGPKSMCNPYFHFLITFNHRFRVIANRHSFAS